jgi:nucleoside-diphosphate-sugar epimerase
VADDDAETFQWLGRAVLVTGGTGFVGRQLVTALLDKGAGIRVLTRSPERSYAIWGPRASRIETVRGDLCDPPSLAGLCAGIDTLFHLAGFAHAEDVTTRLEDSPHWRITVEGTEALLADACAAAVKRLVFVSSVKATGESGDECLDETSAVEPGDHYGVARREAERRVLAAGLRCGMHAAVLRPALVYGHDNAGNLPRMISAIARGRFAPPPETHNRRSMVHVEDLVQALLLAAEQPRANGRTYIVTDDDVYSARRIYEAICRALGRQPAGWGVPARVLRGAARIGDALQALGLPVPLTGAAVNKLLGSAWYSCERAKRELGYRPRHRLEDALPEMVAHSHGLAADPGP